MAGLPKDRITGIQLFYISGVELCGVVSVTLKIQGKQPIKMYIAVFVCFASKDVHLETVNDLSTDSFVCFLKRFFGRRGLPKLYWNGEPLEHKKPDTDDGSDCLEWDHFPIHSSSSSPLRWPM